MRILFDQGTPKPLIRSLQQHSVTLPSKLGWDRLFNGDLLKMAETQGFELLITTDKNLGYQQNLKDRKIGIIVLGNGQWPDLRPYVDRVVAAVDAAIPGCYVEVDMPSAKAKRP